VSSSAPSPGGASPRPTPPPLPGPGADAVTADRWRVVGLALHGIWAALLLAAVLLWVRTAFFGDSTSEVTGVVRLLGAPFALLAVAVLWWVWRSARRLRAGGREGWTVPLALGGVAIAQAALTGMPLLATAGSGGGAPGAALATLGGGVALGAVSLGAALLGRRSWDRLAADTDRTASEATAPDRTASDLGRPDAAAAVPTAAVPTTTDEAPTSRPGPDDPGAVPGHLTG
jgi:hypothetical protein